MNWSDERYVKFYTRKTATWVTWPWQARACLPSFLAVADGAGLLDCGDREPLRALAALTLLPVEVVEAGVAAMVETGTLERVERGWLLPKFLEAQEATKTPRAKKRDQRERDRAQAREISMPPVTSGHQASPAVTECPPPAQPSPPPPPAHHHHQPKKRMRVAPALTPEGEVLKTAWNDMAAATRLPSWLHGRELAAQRALERRPLDEWRAVFARIAKSSFCLGATGWRADIDWALRPAGSKPEPAAKVLEGAYDDRPGAGRGPIEPQIHGDGPIVATTAEVF